MRRRCCLFGLSAVLLLILGCSQGPRSYRVTGTVTLDDKPVLDGDIHFIDTTGRWGAEVAKIKDGRYEVLAKAGPKRVEISASRILPGGARGGGGEPVAEEYIPEEYNATSRLAADVTADGKNEFDFRLHSRKKK